MPLKTLVKVGNISNLSDARYCAGMGVEMLGFVVIEGRENFMSSKSYQEIRGWISGPSVVAEMYGIGSETNINSIIEDYAPDLLEINLEGLSYLPNDTLPLIISIDQSISSIELKKLELIKERIAFILIRDSENSMAFVKKISNYFPVLIALESADVNNILSTHAVNGISLNGSQEIRPGLKDYSHLANVLEQLESE